MARDRFATYSLGYGYGKTWSHVADDNWLRKFKSQRNGITIRSHLQFLDWL